MAVRRFRLVGLARLTARDELDRDGFRGRCPSLRSMCTSVPPASVNEAPGEYVRPAQPGAALVVRHRAADHEDQARSLVRVPTGGLTRGRTCCRRRSRQSFPYGRQQHPQRSPAAVLPWPQSIVGGTVTASCSSRAGVRRAVTVLGVVASAGRDEPGVVRRRQCPGRPQHMPGRDCHANRLLLMFIPSTPSLERGHLARPACRKRISQAVG